MSNNENSSCFKHADNTHVIKGKKYKRILSKWRGCAGSWHYTWDMVLVDENNSQ